MRGLFTRGPAVPEPVRRAAGRSVLAWTQAADGTWLAGTRDALVLVPQDAGDDAGPGAGDDPGSERWPWEQVHRADWDTDERTLSVERVQDWGVPTAPRSFVLAEPGSFLVLLRERVTASIVLQRRVEVRRKKGLSVIGRRPPGGTGAITWAYQFDVGVEPDDPEVRALAEATLREAQESLGLT